MKNKGISLITLIITIVIIIILAAAVILTLTNKNPINDANLAAVMNNRDLMQSKILFHVSNKTAAEPERDLNAKTILTLDDETKIIDDTVQVIEVTKDGKKIKLYRIDKNKYKNNIKDDVAEKPSTGSEWYVNEYGNLFLVYDFITSVPDYMKDGDGLSPNVEDFVIIMGELLEKSIIDSVVIGDTAENGVLEFDFSNVENFNGAWIEVTDTPNKLGTDESNYSNEITNETTIDLGTDSLGNKYAHVLVSTTDTKVEIVKEIEITKLADVWDGTTVATGFARGTGTEADPYIIETAAQLIYFRNTQNANQYAYSQKYIKLINDIDLNNIEWEPIGKSIDYEFAGIFDGDNHNIYNLKITENISFAGLFGTISGATIKNISVYGEISGSCSWSAGICALIRNVWTSGIYFDNCKNYVNIYNSSSNGASAGIIAGYGDGNSKPVYIENCENHGNIVSTERAAGIALGSKKGRIINCFNTGNIQTGQDAGGIGAIISQTIMERCYNTGDITSRSGYAAGLAGEIYGGTVKECYNTGNILNTGRHGAGGLFGCVSDSPTISNCYNRGNVEANYRLGGIIGSGGSCTINNSYTTGVITNRTASYSVGVISGDGARINNTYFLPYVEDQITDVRAKTEEEFTKPYTDEDSVAYLLNQGKENEEDPDVWTTVSGVNGGYPILKWQVE